VFGHATPVSKGPAVTPGPPVSAPGSGDWGPSFGEIVQYLAPTEPSIVERLVRYGTRYGALDRPLNLENLLDLGVYTEAKPFVELEPEWQLALISAGERGLARWVSRATSFLPIPGQVIAAVEMASGWWLPVLRAIDGPNATEVEILLQAMVEIGRDPTSQRDSVRFALETRRGLPRSSPPPPYVGHYCASIWRLAEALANPPGHEALARSLHFAVVAPDGSRRSREIAAAVMMK
jgi:hypothetical protein